MILFLFYIIVIFHKSEIEKATKLTSIDYPAAIDALDDTYEKYNIQKQKYEELSEFSDKDKKQIFETKRYDIVYLWELVGKYANKYNLTINLDVKNGSGAGLYNLGFNISGQYVNISQFINAIENNSDLYFRIYNFKMSGSSEIVAASFTVKDVNIDPSTLISTSATVASLE